MSIDQHHTNPANLTKTDTIRRLQQLSETNTTLSEEEKNSVIRNIESSLRKSWSIKEGFESFLFTKNFASLAPQDVIVLKTYAALFWSPDQQHIEINDQLNKDSFQAIELLMFLRIEQAISQLTRNLSKENAYNPTTLKDSFKRVYGEILYNDSIPLNVRLGYLQDLIHAVESTTKFNSDSISELRWKRKSWSFWTEEDKPDSYYINMILGMNLTNGLWAQAKAVQMVYADTSVRINGHEYHKPSLDTFQQKTAQLDDELGISTKELYEINWDLEVTMVWRNTFIWITRLIQRKFSRTHPEVLKLQLPDSTGGSMQRFNQQLNSITLHTPSGDKSMAYFVWQYSKAFEEFRTQQVDNFRVAKDNLYSRYSAQSTLGTVLEHWRDIIWMDNIVEIDSMTNLFEKNLNELWLPDYLIMAGQILTMAPFLGDVLWVLRDSADGWDGINVNWEAVTALDSSLNVTLWILWVVWMGMWIAKLNKSKKVALFAKQFAAILKNLPRALKEYQGELPDWAQKIIDAFLALNKWKKTEMDSRFVRPAWRVPHNPDLENRNFSHLQNIFEWYKEIFPFLKGKTLDEWAVHRFGRKLNTADVERNFSILDRFKDFIKNNSNATAKINYNRPVDLAHPWATCRVYQTTLDNWKTVVAKVPLSNDLDYLSGTIQEWYDIKIAGDLWVGPQFHWFQITPDWQVAILMDKIEWYDVEPLKGFIDGKSFINHHSIATFKEKMAKLHRAGYTFTGDAWQILIWRDWEVHFMDIDLTPLDKDWMFVDYKGKARDPTTTETYMRHLNMLYESKNINESSAASNLTPAI